MDVDTCRTRGRIFVLQFCWRMIISWEGDFCLVNFSAFG